MLRAARVNAQWVAPPSIDEIRARDQERLLESVSQTGDAAEEDLVVARQLLEQRSAEEIAAALIRVHRQRLPAPEELFDSGPDKGRGQAGRNVRDSGPRAGFEATGGAMGSAAGRGRGGRAGGR